jgi:glyoxylase-like metal-dependent hydrolase (beta-lactamase superfamily II)
MKIGKYEIKVMHTGTFALDGGAMFGIIPKIMWSRINPPDDQNRITLGAKVLLLESESKKILIDTGFGLNWDEKFNNIYRVDNSINTLANSLMTENIKEDEITDVLLTHLHFDHTGGSTRLENGKWVPTFPNAKYHVQKKHFDWALNPSEKDRASFINNRFLPLAENGILSFIDGEEEFDEHIKFLPVNGHTFSQQMIKISDQSDTLIYCGDLFPTSSHIPIPYVMGYDLEPLVTIAEKKKILPQAINENWKLFFEHDPEIIMATIATDGKSFMLNEVFEEMI